MTELIPEAKPNEPNIYIEAAGHLRYFVVEEGEHKVKERIPLHIFYMTDEVQRNWHFKKLVTKAKRKMFLKKIGPRKIATVTPIRREKA